MKKKKPRFVHLVSAIKEQEGKRRKGLLDIIKVPVVYAYPKAKNHQVEMIISRTWRMDRR